MSLRQRRRRFGGVLAATALAAGAVLGTAAPASAEYEYCGGDYRWPRSTDPTKFCYVVWVPTTGAAPTGAT